MWRIIAIAAIFVVALTGCRGQYEDPTPEIISEDLQFITVERPDGTTMPCVIYADGGVVGNAGYSWFGLDCDWN